MSDIAIKIEGLGKRYRYGGAAPLSANLRSDLTDWMKGMFGRRASPQPTVLSPQSTPSGLKTQAESDETQSSANSGLRTQDSGHKTTHPTLHQIHEKHLDADPNYFWALRDINFEVRHGEVVGIIGRNGAGKSTLLKILSRITPPTTGKITYNGRMASLLEVGTGFHRELTGRENIYLNGSILGMKRTEIAKKFDEIVAFAEVEKFIDTPVKFYSSGMYVRLAFAVAAHLDTDIMLVDEVLAVGDVAFQQKCMGKMEDVSRIGRTVLFVSHNMGAISRLCTKCVLLSRGQLEIVGSPSDVVRHYVAGQTQQASIYEQPPAPEKAMHLRCVRTLANNTTVQSQFAYHDPVTIAIDYDVNQRVSGGSVGIGLFTADGTCAFCSCDFDCQPSLLEERKPGAYSTFLKIPASWLNTGRYTITVYVTALGVVYDKVDAAAFHIVETETPGSRHGVNYRKGVLQPLLPWTTQSTSHATG